MDATIGSASQAGIGAERTFTARSTRPGDTSASPWNLRSSSRLRETSTIPPYCLVEETGREAGRRPARGMSDVVGRGIFTFLVPTSNHAIYRFVIP
jgi:hypothetical protein